MLSNQNPDPAQLQKRPFLLWRPFVALRNWLLPQSVAHADRQPRVARFVAAGLVLLVCIGAVVFVLSNLRSWRRSYKHWQSSSLAEEAAKYERKADEFRDANKRSEYADTMAKAFKTANEAYAKDPDNPEAVRVAARLYTRYAKNESRWLWNKLDKLHATTDEDVAWRIQALTLLKEDKSAAEQIEQVLREREATQKIVDLADQVMQNLGRTQQLIDILRDYLKKKPEDLDTRLVLGMRLTEFGATDRAKREGLDMLWELAANESQVGLKAIEFINKSDLTAADMKRLIDRLDHHPLATETHRIAALKRRVKLEPERKEEILRAAVESHRGQKREDLVPLAHWLFEEHDADKILSLLKEEEVRDYPPLLKEYFNALSLQERYTDLERLVKDPRCRFTTAERDFYLVHLAFVKNTLTKQPMDEIDKLLVTAVVSATRENQVQMLLELGHYADVRKHYRTSMEAYKAASMHSATERAGYEGLLKASYNLGSMKDYAAISHETARRWPSNQYFTVQYLYACLLSGESMETSADRASRLLEARPKDSQCKLLMALASHRFGDREACARHLQNSTLQDLTPGQRAVFCGLAQNAGFTNEATKLAAEIPDDAPMLPEEEKFLRIVKPVSKPAESGQ